MILTKILYDALFLLFLADVAFISINAFLPPLLALTQALNTLITATIVCALLLVYIER